MPPLFVLWILLFRINIQQLSMATKILGLDALEHIRDYVDGASSNINYRIDTELKNHIVEKINEASTHIQSDYDSKYNTLIDRISYVEQNGSADELEDLRLELEELQRNTENKFNALDGIERELTRLTTDYQDLYEGVTTGTVFNGGQLNEIINTAMINKVDISPNTILTPEMYAAKLVALIGNFGQINAANIIGGDIKGHTISSNNLIEGTEDPVWTIRDGGDGWLAKKNISWDANGNVTFGEDVKISFDSVTGADEKLQDLMSNYDSRLQTYVEDYVKNSSVAAVDRQMLQDALDAAKTDVDTAMSDLETTLSNSIDSKVTNATAALSNTIGKVETYLGAGYALEGATLQAQLNNVTEAAKQAAQEGNTEIAEGLKNLQKDLEDEIKRMTEKYNSTKNTLDSLSSDVQSLKTSGLSSADIAKLIGTSMITSTDVAGDYVMTPELLAQKIVALVATFGTVNASRIVGTDIQGYTISSPHAKKDEDGNIIYKEGEYELAYDQNGEPIQAVDPDTNKPLWTATGDKIYVYATDPQGNKIPVPDTVTEEDLAWILRADGTGHLANGAIKWEKSDDPNEDDEFNISITGDNISIDGNVKINGSAIIQGIKTDIEDNPSGDSANFFDELFAKEITADRINALNGIVATDISAETITGKTIQSAATNSAWELNENGSGHLAYENISWDKSGTLTANNMNITNGCKIGNELSIMNDSIICDEYASDKHIKTTTMSADGITFKKTNRYSGLPTLVATNTIRTDGLQLSYVSTGGTSTRKSVIDVQWCTDENGDKPASYWGSSMYNNTCPPINVDAYSSDQISIKANGAVQAASFIGTKQHSFTDETIKISTNDTVSVSKNNSLYYLVGGTLAIGSGGKDMAGTEYTILTFAESSIKCNTNIMVINSSGTVAYASGESFNVPKHRLYKLIMIPTNSGTNDGYLYQLV